MKYIDNSNNGQIITLVCYFNLKIPLRTTGVCASTASQQMRHLFVRLSVGHSVHANPINRTHDNNTCSHLMKSVCKDTCKQRFHDSA